MLNFIDFRKAFDSVHRDTLWKILNLYGVPGKFITIFKGLYENSRSCVRTNVGTTDYFNVCSGVRQGCVLSHVFFLLIIDFVMTKAMNLECGIIWGNGTLSDLDFADDIALIGKNRKSIQDMTTNLREYGKKIGLEINAKKTKTMSIGHHLENAVTVEGTDVVDVQELMYLGSKIVASGESDADVQARIYKAASLFNRLGSIWNSSTIRKETKIKLYSAIVVPTALYACETWRKTIWNENKVNIFHRKCLRKIFKFLIEGFAKDRTKRFICIHQQEEAKVSRACIEAANITTSKTINVMGTIWGEER